MEKLLADGHVKDIPYDPGLPVETYWDLGISDSTVIVFIQQTAHGTVNVIDCYSGTGKALPEYIKIVQEKNYVYSIHNFPHDIRHTEIGTGKTRLEVAEQLLGVRNINIIPNIGKSDGIQACRGLLSKCWFDDKNTIKLRQGLESYHRSYDAKNKIYRDRPVHDWASDYADAFRYVAIGISDMKPVVIGKKRSGSGRKKNNMKKSWMAA
jgi:hypothetical protein